MSLLHYFAWSSKTSAETFKQYHERSSLDLGTVDAEGRSILHLAAQRGNLPLVRYLLWATKDSNINDSDCRGRTALHYAVESKRARPTITALISRGANIWARDCHDRSGLHHAARRGNLPAVKALVAFGMADELRTADRFGMTPLKLATHEKTHPVLTFLMETESRLADRDAFVGLDRVGCRHLSTAESDGLVGRSLSAPIRSSPDALLVVQRNHYPSMNWSPRWQRQQYWLSGFNAPCCLICFAAIMTIWKLLALFS